MIEQSPARKSLAAIAALVLTVVGFQQLLTVPPVSAMSVAAPLA